MVASVLDLITLEQMKHQLEFGSLIEDDSSDDEILHHMESALKTVDSYVRYNLLDQTIQTDIPPPGRAPIVIKVVNLHYDNQETATPPTIKYWLSGDVSSDGILPIGEPNGTITPSWIDTAIKGQVALYPPADGWPQLPTRYQRYRIIYQVGMRVSEVPVPIRQAVILLTRRLYYRRETMGPDVTWLKLLGPFRSMTV